MHKHKGWLSLAVITSLIAFAGIAIAADTISPWLRADSPILTSINALPDNTLPPSSNIDCSKITTRYADSNTMREDCVVQVAHGLAGSEGVIFTGSSESTRVVPPYGYSDLRPVPGQNIFITYSSAPGKGLYMHFYTSIRDKMPPAPERVNGRLQYRLTKDPDFSLRHTDGQLLPVNPQTLTFSANGNWMAIDIFWMGFVRINMASFDMVPFAQSMNMGSDYANYEAQIGLSHDGRYAAVKPGNTSELIVYDIQSCKDTVMPVRRDRPKCQSRDYWPYIASRMTDLRMVYQPRFISDAEMSFSALYGATSSGKFKATQYTITAPGERPGGIEYLGMGDSFASGQGAFNYMIGTDTGNNTCHLSSLSYPFLLSASLFSSGHSVACSGAKIRDIIDASEAYEGQVKDGIAKKERSNPGMIYTNYLPGYFIQNEFVQKYNPRAVTLSIGGNDIGFSDIVKQCVMPKLRNTTCYPTYEDQKELANRISSIGSKLTNAYRTISNVGRRVYVIGYPQIVASNGNCAANVHLDAKEIELFTGLTDVLNATIKDAAEKANAQYVDVSEAFVGHRMCETKSSDVAVNGFTTGNDDGLKRMKFIGSESYHPNALGHELLARAVLGQTNNLKQATTFPNPALSPVIFPLPQAPKTARATSFSIYSSTLLPDIITSSSPIAIQVDADTALLKSSSEFTVKLDDSGIVLGTANTDTKGNLTGGVTLPAVTTCGYHTVHVAGVNLLGQAIDISKVVYVNSEAGTCSETNDSLCGSVPSSGQDADQDKLDDACDPLITDPPTTPTYTVHLTGSYIHAVKTTRGIAATITPPNAAPLPTEEVMAPVSVRSRQTAYWKVGENIVTSFALFLVLVCGGQLRGRRKL